MLDILAGRYRQFRALPWLVQRAVVFVLAWLFLFLGVKVTPWSSDLAAIFLLIAWAAAAWSTGFLYVLRGAWFIARIWIRMKF